jgi:hypothetical protein
MEGVLPPPAGADSDLKLRRDASKSSVPLEGLLNSGLSSLLAFGVAPAAHVGWNNPSGSHLAFMGSAWGVGTLTLGHWANSLPINSPPLSHVRLTSP